MFKTKTKYVKRLLSLLLAILLTASLFVALPLSAEAYDYGDPVYLEFYFDKQSYNSATNARVALDCFDYSGGTYHPPNDSLHVAARAPDTELFRLKDPNKPLAGGLRQMFICDNIITTFTSSPGRLIIPTYMDYPDFLAAYNYMYGVLDWSRVDYSKVIMPNDYTYTPTSTGNRNDKVTFPQWRDYDPGYTGDLHQIVWVTAVTQKQDALSMTVKGKPTLQLDYEGASYAPGIHYIPEWNISAVITNTASYPVYVRPEVKFFLQDSETQIAQSGNYEDPDKTGNFVIDGILPGSDSEIIMIPPGGQFEYTPTPIVNPPTNDMTIRAEVTVENLTSVQQEKVIGSATTLFPKATGVKNGLKLTGVYPTEVKVDEVFTATLFGINFSKIDLDTFTAYDSDILPHTPEDITDPPIEAEFINHTNERLDIVFPNGLTEGYYVFSFQDIESTPNDYYFRIEASPSNETPVWPVYGLLSVHQQSSQLFDVFGSGSEAELGILPAEPLLTFRGMVRQDSATEYYIADGATINGTVQFRCQDGDETKNFLKLTTGASSGDSWGEVTIESLSADAVLLFDGTVVAQGIFKIVLDSANKYSISRTPGTGETKVALSYATPGYFFVFDSYGVEIHAGGLIIYENTVGISGEVGLSEVIPGFIKQYFFNVFFNLEELQLSRYAPPAIKASGEFHVGTIFDIIEASANMDFSMNTLPEAEVAGEQHIYMKGDVTIFDYIQLIGLLRLEAARGIYLPENFEFFVRGGWIGVPLIPALHLATINGFGGGFQGLASTIDNRFNYIPNLALIFSGSIGDVTDTLISLDKSTFTVGLRGVEGKTDNVKILGMDLLKNISYSVLLTDQLYSITLPGNAVVRVPGVEVTLKGGFSLPFECLDATGSIMVGVYPSINLNDLADKIASLDPNAVWDVLDMFEFKGTASGTARIPNFMPAPFGGLVVANAKAEMTKYRASIRASLPGIGIGEIGLWIDFPYKDQSIGIGLLSFDPSADSGTISATGIDENGETYTVTMMNVRRPTIVNNNGSITPLAFAPPGDNSVGKSIVPLFSIVGSTADSLTVNVDSGDPYLVFALETDTPGDIKYTVTDPNGYVNTVTTKTSDGDWYEAENFNGDIVYRSLCGIDEPDEGNWTLMVTGSTGVVSIDAYVIDRLPEINNVTYSSVTKTVSWDLSNLDSTKQYIVDLFVVQDGADKETDIGQYLGTTAEFTSITSTVTSLTVTMPDDLPSDDYVIRAMLSQTDSDELSPLQSTLSAPFTYANPNAPGVVTGLTVEPNGNGTVKVSWTEPSFGANGYVITVTDGGSPVIDSDGNELKPIVISDTFEEDGVTPIDAPTEYVLQGGKYIDENGVERGYKYDYNYTVNVSAFNQVDMGEIPVYDENGDITDETTPVSAKVTGTADSKTLNFKAPVPPSFDITFTGATEKTSAAAPELPIYIGQSPKATVEIPTGCVYAITRNGISYTGVLVGGDVECEPDAADGTYTFVVTVTNSTTHDSTEKRFVLIKDTTPPVLQIDGSGAILSNDGTINFSGNTDPDALLTLNDSGSGFDRDGALFSFSGAVTGDAITLTAKDDAGNETVLTRPLVSQSTDVVSISISADIDGVDIGNQIPLTTSPKFIFSALRLSGSEDVLNSADTALDWYGSVSITPVGAATVYPDGTIYPTEPGLITLFATYTDEYGQEFTAGGVFEIVDALPIRDLAYTASGNNGADLKFTPPVGASTVKLQYSPDDANWSDYSQGTLNASGGTAIVSNLAYDQTYYFRLLVIGGLNDGASNSVEIMRMTPDSPPPNNNSGGGTTAPAVTKPEAGGGVDNPFVDVKGSDWFYDAVMYAYERGLMVGVAPDMFSPNSPITRAMVVTVLFRLAEKNGMENGKWKMENEDGSYDETPNSSLLTPNFSDVSDGTWYSDAVSWAAANGIVNGYGGGLFGPNDNITRQDLTVILMRYADYMGTQGTGFRGQDSGNDGYDETPNFTDDADIRDYAKEAVDRFFKEGIIGGYPDGGFKPQRAATRAEFATILQRFLESPQ